MQNLAAYHAIGKAARPVRLALTTLLAIAALLAAAMLAATPSRALADAPDCPEGLAAASIGAGRGSVDDRKLVVVGDSYSCANKKGIVPWPRLAAKRLGLERDQYQLVRHRGYSFAREGRRFVSLLRKQAVDPDVTHVLIMGGVGNDYETSCKNSIKHYGKTVNMIRAKYPNAKVMHAVTSWRLKNKSYQKAIVKRIPVFRKTAKKLGVTYLTGCENIMKDHPGWFLPDAIHPNQKGHAAIAKLVAGKLARQGLRAP